MPLNKETKPNIDAKTIQLIFHHVHSADFQLFSTKEIFIPPYSKKKKKKKKKIIIIIIKVDGETSN